MSDRKPLSLGESLQEVADFNQLQQLKSIGNQPRSASTSPNAISATNSPALSTPKHVFNVQATLSRTSDVTSKVTVTFQQDPSDYFFANAQVYVSGYKGNAAPVLMGSGHSPISFALENSGDAVTVTVQAVGNLGPAPLATAPTTTLKLDKTNLVTVATTTGNGTAPVSSGGINPSQTARTGDVLVYNEYGAAGWDPTNPFDRWVCVQASNGGGNAASAPQISGACQSTLAGNIGAATLANVVATATEGYSLKTTSSATASTSTNNGWTAIQGNAGQGYFPFATFRRFKSRVCFQTTTNVRWWLGMFEATQAITTATDTPNTNYCAFRFSAGTDAHIKAVCGQSSAAQTVVDTGISIDTVNSQLFEIARDSTHFYFYINGALVATISTTLPSSTSVCSLAVFGDNKNTANSNVLLFQYMNLTMR